VLARGSPRSSFSRARIASGIFLVNDEMIDG
jgi:hypothetical protein